jgi:flagella basal body P-ring formation protein FlgA
MSRQILVLALAAALLAAPAAAQTAVDGDWVSLGDVAPVTGEAAAILLAPAPPAGQTLALDPAFIMSVAKKSGVYVSLPVDRPVLVARKGAAEAPRAPVAKTAAAANVAKSATTSAGAPGEILVLVRDRARGDVIVASDLEWRKPDGMAPRNTLPDIAFAAGQELRRPLRAGAPVLTSDIKAVSLVRKGEPVKLVYTSPGLKLTVDGVAQADAAMGDSVRVLNNYTRRSVDAVASATGEARISR